MSRTPGLPKKHEIRRKDLFAMNQTMEDLERRVEKDKKQKLGAERLLMQSFGKIFVGTDTLKLRHSLGVIPKAVWLTPMSSTSVWMVKPPSATIVYLKASSDATPAFVAVLG